MPSTAENTTREEANKKVNKQTREKSVIRGCESVTSESATRASQGAGETPIKPKPRQKKPGEKPAVRTTPVPVANSVPKKNAQRAKGSISLNKTLEQAEPEPKLERRLPARSVDKIKGDNDGVVAKPPAPVTKRKKKKQLDDKGRLPKGGPKGKGLHPEKQASCESLDESTLEVVDQEVSETKAEEPPRVVNPAFNSCSFFGRLQQGVRAYFTSRSSFNPEDRNKKEGGIRTRARVAKGVKEDVKTSKSGLELLKSISSSESDFFYELLRVNSSVGGQSSNFLSTKPKILRHFRKLKRKKLYHPKKHYVRIQIPRKGYFYRSFIRLQSPGSTTPEPLRVLEPRGRKKKIAKVQYPGMASTSPQSSHPSAERRLRKTEMASYSKLMEGLQHPSDIFPSDYMEQLLYQIDALGPDFENKVYYYIAMNWPGGQTNDNALVGIADSESNGGGRTGTVLENSFGIDSQKTKSETEKNWSEVPGTWEDQVVHSKQSCDTLLDCLSKEQLVRSLESTPPSKDEEFSRQSCLQTIEEEHHPTILTTLDFPDSMDSDTVCTSVGSSSTLSDSESTLSSSITASLMEGVDLHLELQNYLKALDSCQNIKSRTKNTLQSNFHDNYIPLNIHSSSQSLQTRTEEFHDTRENKSGASFDSAASHFPKLEEIPNEVLLDMKRDSGPAPAEQRRPPEPQKESMQRSSAVKLSIGSTSMDSFRLGDKTTWGCPFPPPPTPKSSGEDSKDSYEKILPFSPKSSTTGGKKTSTCVFQNAVQVLSGQCARQGIWKAASDTGRVVPKYSKVGTLGSETSSSEILCTNLPAERKLSLTLQELIDIYNDVLKRNKKIRKSKSLCLSSVASFLNTRLKDKNSQHDSNSEEEKKSESVSLEDYVTMFQEILQSSLSIHQITQLNNIIANLQDYSEKNYSNLMKELSEDTRKYKKVTPIKMEPEQKMVVSSLKQEIPVEERKESQDTVKPTSPVRNQKSEKTQKPLEKEQKKQASPTAKARPKSKKVEKRKKKFHHSPPPPEETIEQIQLPAPTALESILKLGYGSESVVFKDSVMADGKNKLLVTVKLSGNQVLVSDLSYFNNEKALSVGKPQKRGTSELIIENVTNEQIWYKNTKSSRLRFLNRPVEEPPKKTVKKTKKIRKVKFKVEKMGSEENIRNHFKAPNSRFEYDQLQLRAQHPIDAIAEISESKVSQEVDFSDQDQGKAKPVPPPETKKAQKEGSEKKATNDWKVEALPRSKPRTKGRKVTFSKKKQVAIIRSIVDLKKRPTNKNRLLRPRRTHLCYPSVQKIQTKPESSERRPVAKTASPFPLKIKPSKTQQTVKLCKKPTEAEAKRKKSGSVCQMTEPKAAISPKSSEPLQKTPKKPSGNTVLYLNSDVVSDCCSIEFLFSENREEPVAKRGSERFICSPSEKEILKGVLPPANSDFSFRNQVSVMTHKSESLEKSHESPIALFPPVSCSEVTNFPTEIIHSDSFLINFPSLSVSQSKFHSLIKASSDFKFYPGRITESDHEETPLVTFVLTPSQNDTASLPANQVTVVRKKSIKSAFANESQTGETTTDDDGESEGKDEDNLKTIENFINHMAKCRKAVEKKKKSESTKGSPKIRPTPMPQPPTSRKIYHECQFRKAEDINKRNTLKNPKENKKNKGKAQTSDVILDKLVTSLSHVLENFQKEKEEKGTEAGDSVEEKSDGMKRPKTSRGRVKYELKGMSVNPSDISLEMVEAVKRAIAQAEGFSEKKEIISAIEEGLSKQRNKLKRGGRPESAGDLGTTSKKLKMVKIKIQRTDQKQPKDKQEESKQVGPATGEIELLDSLVSKDTESFNLTRQNSTYFDALEKTEEENLGGGGEEVVAVNNKEDKLEDSFFFSSDKLKDNPDFSLSDEKLFAGEILKKESEEMIFYKISKSLEKGHVLYSMTLLESFLKKVEDSSDCVRLKKLLALVENKSKNLMLNLERSAWLKVLSLLEEVTQVFESQNMEDKAQLKTTKEIINKIQFLNMNRLSDLQKFCSSFSQSRQEDDVQVTILARIKDSFKHLKEKFLLKRSPCEDSTDSDISGSEAALKVHSTVSLPEIREDYLKRKNQQEEKNQAQELKRRLQQQYFCIQELMKADKEEDEVAPPEIGELKRKVAERMKLLEKFDHQILEENSEEPWKRTTSLLKLAQNCRKEEAVPGGKARVSLDRSPGYVDLMKCLIKAWDTRMTINSISNECFG